MEMIDDRQNMLSKRKILSGFLRYSLSIPMVGLAYAVRVFIESFVGGHLPTYITFYPVVLFVSLWAGSGPGLMTVGLSALVTAIWVLEPTGRLVIYSLTEMVGMIMYFALGFFMVSIVSHYRRSRVKLLKFEQEHAKILAELNRTLEQRVDERTADLRRQQDLLSTLITNTTDLIYIKDKQSRFLLANHATVKHMRAERPEDLMGKTDFDFFPKELATLFYTDEQEIIRTGKPLIAREEPALGPNGERMFVSTTKVPLRDASGKVVGIVGIGRDVTAQKLAQQHLEEERTNLQTMFNSVNVGMLLIDEKGRIQRSNDTIKSWVGREPTDVSYRQPGDALGCINAIVGEGCGHNEHCYACATRNTFESVICSGKPVHNIETELKVSVNGKVKQLWLEVNADPLTLGGRKYVLLSMTDISIRKKAEDILKKSKEELEALVNEKTDQLLRAKRLSDLGTLAATVAHELRNPLAGIQIAAVNIRRKAQNANLDQHLQTIEKKIQESSQIIDNLLFYTRLRAPHFDKVNINAIINECIDLVKDRYQGQKEVIVTGYLDKTENVIIDADPLQMKEVMNNVLGNAFDAIKENGEVTILTENKDSVIEIGVTDNGVGVQKENVAKLFQPFFSTKAKGTGLGLAVCNQIVSHHGGSISIQSEWGEGTQVNIILPKRRQGGDVIEEVTSVTQP